MNVTVAAIFMVSWTFFMEISTVLQSTVQQVVQEQDFRYFSHVQTRSTMMEQALP